MLSAREVDSVHAAASEREANELTATTSKKLAQDAAKFVSDEAKTLRVLHCTKAFTLSASELDKSFARRVPNADEHQVVEDVSFSAGHARRNELTLQLDTSVLPTEAEYSFTQDDAAKDAVLLDDKRNDQHSNGPESVKSSTKLMPPCVSDWTLAMTSTVMISKDFRSKSSRMLLSFSESIDTSYCMEFLSSCDMIASNEQRVNSTERFATEAVPSSDARRDAMIPHAWLSELELSKHPSLQADQIAEMA